MKSAIFEYKCRRCGEIELNPFCPAHMASVELILVSIGKKSNEPMGISLYRIHGCKDGGSGLSDLLGFGVEGK